MSDDLALRALGMPGIAVAAGALTRDHLGREIAVQTGAAVYVGTLHHVAQYPNRVYLAVEREAAKADAQLEPNQPVWVAG